MYAVIFRARLAQADDEYLRVADRLRERAKTHFGCLEFVSVNEGGEEISISYWPTLSHIRAWKDDPEHRAAQARGKSHWYRSWRVEVCEVTGTRNGRAD